MKTLVLLALALTGCAALKQEAKDFKDGAVTCLEDAKPAALALGASILTGALADALSGSSAEDVFKHAGEAAEAGALKQGIPVAACAFDGVIADLVKVLHPEPQSLMFRSLEPDPAELGQRAFSDFASKHGVTSIRR